MPQTDNLLPSGWKFTDDAQTAITKPAPKPKPKAKDGKAVPPLIRLTDGPPDSAAELKAYLEAHVHRNDKPPAPPAFGFSGNDLPLSSYKPASDPLLVDTVKTVGGDLRRGIFGAMPGEKGSNMYSKDPAERRAAYENMAGAAMGMFGTVDMPNAGPRGFFSSLQKEIGGLKDELFGKEGISVGKLKNLLSGRGVTKQEMKWSGLADIMERSTKITKGQLMDVLANRPTIREQVLGTGGQHITQEVNRLRDIYHNSNDYYRTALDEINYRHGLDTTEWPAYAIEEHDMYLHEMQHAENAYQKGLVEGLPEGWKWASDPASENEYNFAVEGPNGEYLRSNTRHNIYNQIADQQLEGGGRTQYNHDSLKLPGPHDNYREILLKYKENDQLKPVDPWVDTTDLEDFKSKYRFDWSLPREWDPGSNWGTGQPTPYEVRTTLHPDGTEGYRIHQPLDGLREDGLIPGWETIYNTRQEAEHALRQLQSQEDALNTIASMLKDDNPVSWDYLYTRHKAGLINDHYAPYTKNMILSEPDGTFLLYDNERNNDEVYSTLEKAHEALRQTINDQPSKPLFSGSHHGEANVVAHMRLSDRLTVPQQAAQPELVSMAEEHQSDAAKAFRQQLEQHMLAANGHPEMAAKPEPTPWGPFIHGEWPDLTVKRHLLEAARNPNTKWVGWTTGEQQIQRYEHVLRSIADEVRFEPPKPSGPSINRRPPTPYKTELRHGIWDVYDDNTNEIQHQARSEARAQQWIQNRLAEDASAAEKQAAFNRAGKFTLYKDGREIDLPHGMSSPTTWAEVENLIGKDLTDNLRANAPNQAAGEPMAYGEWLMAHRGYTHSPASEAWTNRQAWQEFNKNPTRPATSHILKAENGDFKIQAKWPTHLYDEHLKGLYEKHSGGKMIELPIEGAPNKDSFQVKKVRNPDNPQLSQWAVVNTAGGIQEIFPNQEEALHSLYTKYKQNRVSQQPIHAVPMTEALRAKLLKEGFPLHAIAPLGIGVGLAARRPTNEREGPPRRKP